MKRTRIVAGIVVLLVALSGGAWWYFRARPDVWQAIQTTVSAEVAPALAEFGLVTSTERGVTASGFIEAEEVVVASELGGRLIELYVDDGDDVQVGVSLIRLDDTLIAAHIEMAEAQLATAEARLAQVEVGARPEQVRQVEAALAKARAGRDGAYQAWRDAIALRDNPQVLDTQVAEARARVAVAEAAVEQAEALKDAAEIALDNFDKAQQAIDEAREAWSALPASQRPPKPVLNVQLEFHLIPNQYWKAWVQLNTAKAELDAARTALYDLLRIRENPRDLVAQVDAAEARYAMAEAAVEKTEAQLDRVKAGATREELAMLEAQVRQAEARLITLQREQEKLTVAAPVGGIVLRRSLHPGELVTPGGPIVILGELDKVTLTVYVPETQLGRVDVGQDVEIRVDGFPNRVFTGTVATIAREAEFTPRNVQSEDERVHMVFAVEVRVPNPDHLLKPGVHANATILTGEE
jgi:multidrug resistance efflux pump